MCLPRLPYLAVCGARGRRAPRPPLFRLLQPRLPGRRAGLDGELGRAAQQKGAQHQAQQRHDQAGPERRPEPVQVKAADQFGHQHQHQRVDHQQKQPESQQRERQRQHHQQRPHHRIGQSQQQRRNDQRARAVKAQTLEHVADDPEGEGEDGPVDEEGGEVGKHELFSLVLKLACNKLAIARQARIGSEAQVQAITVVDIFVQALIRLLSLIFSGS